MRLRTQSGSTSPPRSSNGAPGLHPSTHPSSLVLPTTTTHHQRLNGNALKNNKGIGRRRRRRNISGNITASSSQQQQNQIVVSKSAIRTFGILAALFLVSVHLYLFQILLSRASPSTTTITLTEEEAELQLQQPVLGEEISSRSLFQVTPLTRTIDREQYTVRINTFLRLEQLNISIHHHLSCDDAVAQIQVVWCLDQGEPPAFLEEISPKVVIERHTVNSLNERFRILEDDESTQTPTLGILSIDDDVLRPCTAIDSGFFRWTSHPERMVGFDARTHVHSDEHVWKYGYSSTTEHSNQYSITLPRYAFLHKDYLDYYTNKMPRSIYDKVAQNFNCEDIAMSFLVSSLSTPPPTSSIVKPPLLADFWAVRSMIKLYTESKISAGSSHKAIRDECVDEFATTLGLKGKLHHAKLKHSDNYEYGDRISIITTTKEQQPPPPRQVAFQKLLETWKHDMSKNEVVKQWTMLKAMASKDAYLAGLLEGTDPWKERWKHKGSKEEVAPPEEQEDEEGHKEGDLVLPHVDVIVEEEGETR